MSKHPLDRLCACCTTPRLVAPTLFAAKAAIGNTAVDVIVVEYTCPASGQTWTNSQEHDWRLEARTKLNLHFGSPIDTPLPGIRLLRPQSRPQSHPQPRHEAEAA